MMHTDSSDCSVSTQTEALGPFKVTERKQTKKAEDVMHISGFHYRQQVSRVWRASIRAYSPLRIFLC